MTSIESTINKYINDFNPAYDLGDKVVIWRDSNPNIGRKVIAAAGLTAVGLGMLVDTVVSLALTILTSPLYLLGSSIPGNLAKRTLSYGFGVGIVTPIALFENLRSEKLGEAVGKDLKALFGN